uniref:ATP synthase subunit s, mitochondrial n=1 Tax=Strongyloides venezuelensis TaxID=75913 RepID=A0A0K0FVR7_STRVS
MINGISRGLIRIRNRIASHNIPGLMWILEGFNLVDEQRLKDVGPDRCAAEWIVKCGGKIKFDKMPDIFEDYNCLIRGTSVLDPRDPNDNVKLVWIDATNASVTGYGCLHFKGLKNIEEVNFVHCNTLHDHGLEYMGLYVGDVLKKLELSDCPKITEYGLVHLSKFVALKELKLIKLNNVYHIEKVLNELEKSLPDCKIIQQ